MTTVIRTRQPLDVLSMNRPQRKSTKRPAVYDEEDGDFHFTRASKKTKLATAAAPSKPPPAVQPAPPAQDDNPKEKKKATRRTMNFSTPQQKKKESITLPTRGTRRSARLSGEGQIQEAGTNGFHDSRVEKDDVDLAGEKPGAKKRRKKMENSIESSHESTKIALPFSDTPVATRNKELRKRGGSVGRRSSLGLRGRRASSLIDHGHTAIPHREVDSGDFYKHIEDGLIESRRMRQLLTWCGERALGGKPSHNIEDSAARLAARHIQEELLKDFATNSELSDWLKRDETQAPAVIKKPNPKNKDNESKILELEERVKELQEERAQWKNLTKPQPTLDPIIPDPESVDVSALEIDADLLDPEQAEILASLSSETSAMHTQTSSRLKSITTGLEFKIDQFADGVHKLEAYREIAGKVAEKVLALSAQRLGERGRREKEAIGTKELPVQEVLRELSRLLPESSGAR